MEKNKIRLDIANAIVKKMRAKGLLSMEEEQKITEKNKVSFLLV